MKKSEIVAATSEKTGETQRTVRTVMDAATDIMMDTLVKDGAVFLHGLGKLTVKKRARRQARNMVTGEKVIVPAHKTVTYRPSAMVTERVNKRR